MAGQGSNAIANPEPDLNFALVNPALLSDTVSGQLTSSLIDYPSDILLGELAFAKTLPKTKGTWSASLRYMDYGDFDRADPFGVRSGTFTVQDIAFAVGYGFQLDSNWSFGGNLKYIQSNYDIWKSNGMALDLAAVYRIPAKRMTFAFLVKNVGVQFTPYNEERENLPFEIQLGFSNQFEHLPLRWQITLEQLETWDVRYDDPTNRTVNQLTGEIEENQPSVLNNILRHVVLGAELAPTKGFNLQIGYNFRRNQELKLDTRRTAAGISFGIGIRISKFRINYSRNNYHVAGGANHFSLITDLGDFKKKK